MTVGPSQAADLPAIVMGAREGTTILLRDGRYALGGVRLVMNRPGVSLRSASGEAARVVLDGEYRTPELVQIGASDVEVAHVTLTRAIDHLVHIVPAAGRTIDRVSLYGLHLLDAGEQFVKVNPPFGSGAFVDDGRVECSSFRLTETGRARVESLGGTSCYTGGIDVHAGQGWVVRRNRFDDIYCRTGHLAEHAVHFWRGSAGTLVENNTIVNCARGIGFGLGPAHRALRPEVEQTPAGYVGHQGGIIRNNVIYADVAEYDTGIGLEQAADARVWHNTVFESARAAGAFSSIDARFPNTRVDVRNNLVRNLTTRNDAVLRASHNIERVPPSAFVDPAGLDFHLRADFSDAIDRGMVVNDPGVDMDGTPRGARPDIGADESARRTADDDAHARQSRHQADVGVEVVAPSPLHERGRALRRLRHEDRDKGRWPRDLGGRDVRPPRVGQHTAQLQRHVARRWVPGGIGDVERQRRQPLKD
jgi:hypothetical protein